MLQGHPDSKRTPGVGDLFRFPGTGAGSGKRDSPGRKLDNADYRVYVLMGDGEMQEGMIWEAAMAAAHYGLTTW